MIKNLIAKYTKPQALWRIFCMTAAIFLMGFSLSFLILTDMGTDPFTFMNRGFSSVFHISFGTWQLMLNLALFAVTFVLQKNLIGPGTFVNMIAVGYTADFFGSIWNGMEVFKSPMPFGMRLLMLAGALLVFVAAAAVYMTAELGTAPYDALPFIISGKVKKLSFRWVRMIWDSSAMVIGMLLGMKIGIITVLMVVSLGPAVAWFGEHVTAKLLGLVGEA